MELTQEQREIISSTGDIKINAVAGSGKTTTIIEYAKTRPSNAKILYLAFNKSVKLEAIKKFHDRGLHNVHVETAHSLAYRHIVSRSGYRVRNGYKTEEIVDILELRESLPKKEKKKHTEYIVANHIAKFVAYFCNSDKEKVKDLNYLDIVTEVKAKEFVSRVYKYIFQQTRIFLSKMDSGELEITHDFYLKKFQLKNPVLRYDYILFDEGQDASPAMLDVFLKQKATKVIVGDTHQQIYGWRHAVNSLEKAHFKDYFLTVSFRFGQDIANLAIETLHLKERIGPFTHIPIVGKGNSQADDTSAIVARTNLGLLKQAIEYVTDNENVQHIYFEGNFNSYTYAEDGASLYDVLHLYNGQNYLIRNKIIKAMRDLKDLEEYSRTTEDVELAMMIQIVKEYKNDIPDIIETIKSKHVKNEQKHLAQMIFSTVHRCKGMEYDRIKLAEDFISEEKLAEIAADGRIEGRGGPPLATKLNEEINVLYVAVTRARNIIQIPAAFVPATLENSPHIQVIGAAPSTTTPPQVLGAVPGSQPSASERPGKASFIDLTPRGPAPRRSQEAPTVEKDKSWTDKQDDQLLAMSSKGADLEVMAILFNRTEGAIRARIAILERKEVE